MKYQAPSKCFFRLPNEIFNLRLDPFSFEIYAYLVCCAGSRGECWPSMETMHRKLGISIGDINGNGEIDSMDYVYLRRAYFGTYKIK